MRDQCRWFVVALGVVPCNREVALWEPTFGLGRSAQTPGRGHLRGVPVDLQAKLYDMGINSLAMLSAVAVDRDTRAWRKLAWGSMRRSGLQMQ